MRAYGFKEMLGEMMGFNDGQYDPVSKEKMLLPEGELLKPNFRVRVFFKSGNSTAFTGTYEKRSQVVIINGKLGSVVINFSSVDFLEITPMTAGE